jgi:hypothetical protein
MAAATSATQKFEAAAKKAARSPGLQSSIGSEEQAQIRKALELRQRYAGMGGDVAGPVRVTDKMVSDESERIILNRLVRSRNAEEQRAAAASAASNHIIMVQKSEAEAFALSERKKELAISLVNQAISNASELERQQALVTANAIAQTEAKKQAAIEQTAAVNARISEAMALQRGQVLAGMTAPSGNKINAQTSMLVQQAEQMDRQDKQRQVDAMTEADRRWNSEIALMQRTADVQESLFSKLGLRQPKEFDTRINPQTSMFAQQTTSATIETKKLWSAQIQAKVAANTLAYSLGASPTSVAANAKIAAFATKNLGSTSADSTRGFSKMGLVLQQAGYQAQDFAVQVAGGQNALVAFSQQASQMLGFFGVGGAIAGAALTAGILAYKISGIGDAANDATTSLRKNSDAIKELNTLSAKIYQKTGGMSDGRALDIDYQKKQSQFNETERQSAIITANLKKVRAELAANPPNFIESIGAKLAIFQTESKIKDLRNLALNQRIDAENSLLAVIQHRLDLEAKEASAIKGYQDRQTAVMERQNTLQLKNETAGDKYMRLKAYADNFAVGSREDIVRQAEAQTAADEAKSTAEDQASAIKDQLDAKRAIKREDESMRSLVRAKLLDEKDITTLYQMRADKIRIGLQSSIPQSLQVNAGTSALGGVMGSGSGQLLEIQKGILDGIRNLVAMERMAGGVN